VLVSLIRDKSIATLTANSGGDFKWTGGPATGSKVLADLAAATMIQNGWTRGRYLSDDLFLARRIAKAIGGCAVVDAEQVVETLRADWTRLLRNNLMPDPGISLGQHLDDLRPGDGVTCRIECRGEQVSLADGPAHTRCWPVFGTVYVGGSEFLKFGSRTGSTTNTLRYPVRKVRWERIVTIHFSHSKPPSGAVEKSRDKLKKLIAQRDDATGPR
jgi:hypothetical protein